MRTGKAGGGAYIYTWETTPSQEGEMEDRLCGWGVAELGLEPRLSVSGMSPVGYTLPNWVKCMWRLSVSLSHLGCEQL